MRITAALSWYEESPVWLASLVASLKGFCDHIVAVDGAYGLYPGAHERPVSGPEQAEAVIQTAKAIGIGATVHIPEHPWYGNEIEKRTFLFDLANMVSTPLEDWIYVCDGDDILENVPFDAKLRLSETTCDVAEVSLVGRVDWEKDTDEALRAHIMNGSAQDAEVSQLRALVRAIPGLRIGWAHMVYEYDSAEGVKYLRGRYDGVDMVLEPALDLTDLRVEHRHDYRNPTRMKASEEYYALRNDLGAEDAPAHLVA